MGLNTKSAGTSARVRTRSQPANQTRAESWSNLWPAPKSSRPLLLTKVFLPLLLVWESDSEFLEMSSHCSSTSVGAGATVWQQGLLIGKGAGWLRWVEDRPQGFSLWEAKQNLSAEFSPLTLSAVVCVLSDSGGTGCPNTHFPLEDNRHQWWLLRGAALC